MAEYSAGDRPYIRLLGEHAIITVPREDAIITVRKEEDANLTFPEQEDVAINKVSDEDNLRNVVKHKIKYFNIYMDRVLLLYIKGFKLNIFDN